MRNVTVFTVYSFIVNAGCKLYKTRQTNKQTTEYSSVHVYEHCTLNKSSVIGSVKVVERRIRQQTYPKQHPHSRSFKSIQFHQQRVLANLMSDLCKV